MVNIGKATKPLIVLAIALGLMTGVRADDPLPMRPGDDPAPEESGVRLSGMITSRSADLLSVGDELFSITADTVWRYQEQAVIDIDLFDIGDIVLVKAAKQGSVWIALDVALIANLIQDDGVEMPSGPPIATFSGPLEAIGSTSLTIDKTTILYDDTTQWSVAGEPTKDLTLFNPGDEVIVTAAYQGANWMATSVDMLANTVVEIEPPATKTPSAQVYTGQIQALTATRLSLNQTTFVLLDKTEWILADGSDGSAALFEVGDTVQIIAARSNKGWAALRVTMVKDASLS
jgi:hypothetical protein